MRRAGVSVMRRSVRVNEKFGCDQENRLLVRVCWTAFGQERTYADAFVARQPVMTRQGRMMRLAGLPCFVLAFFVVSNCHAAQKFSCDGAEVRIEVVERSSSSWEDRAEAVVTVSREEEQTVLHYRNIDFIGGECLVKRGVRPLVLYQAVCGGSGCKDLANWGVIDPKTLRVLTVPNDSNRDETRKLVGGGPLPRLELMSVLAEARKPGIDALK